MQHILDWIFVFESTPSTPGAEGNWHFVCVMIILFLFLSTGQNNTFDVQSYPEVQQVSSACVADIILESGKCSCLSYSVPCVLT